MKTRYLGLIILFIFPIGQMSIDIYAPSLPAISHDFLASSTDVKLTVSLFVVTYAIAQLFYGPLSDQFGRKKPLITAMLIYIIGTLLATFAAKLYVLYIARFLQGIGVAGIMVIVRAMISESFKGNMLKKISSYIALLFSGSAIISPWIGGLLQYISGWRSVFILLLIYGLISFILMLSLPETHHKRAQFNLLQFIQNSKEIVTHCTFLSAICFQSVVLSFFFVFALQGTFVIQKGLGMSASAFGELALIIGFGVLIGSLINKTYSTRIATLQLIKICFSLMLLTSIIFVIFSCLFPQSLYLMVIASFIWALIATTAGPSFFSLFLSTFSMNAGLSNALSGFATYTLVGIITFIMSHFQQTNLLPICIYTLFASIIAWGSYFAIKRPLREFS
ncbi:MFS transporter [Fangia hongkongensis]|uniref:MFS transporter n=1 Tax=Fangia hongkongensis TaxID=270495 RepID=UPI00037430FB|nr:MFS transporter [Fangia hongkongensis]MBK2125123.1 MFS transporter [Fangia hongkongensis]